MNLSTRTISTNGVDLAVIDEGKGPPVILAHGFPELAYSWRHQIPALVNAGYRVLAPDQRGYGGSSRPEAIEDYDIIALTGDLIGLLDDIDDSAPWSSGTTGDRWSPGRARSCIPTVWPASSG